MGRLTLLRNHLLWYWFWQGNFPSWQLPMPGFRCPHFLSLGNVLEEKILSSTQGSFDLTQPSALLPHSNKHLSPQIPTVSIGVKWGKQDFTTVNTSMCFLHAVLSSYQQQNHNHFLALINSPILSELQHQLCIIWAGVSATKQFPQQGIHAVIWTAQTILVLRNFIPQVGSSS